MAINQKVLRLDIPVGVPSLMQVFNPYLSSRVTLNKLSEVVSGESLTERVSLFYKAEEFSVFCDGHRVVDDAFAGAVGFLGESVDFEVFEAHHVLVVNARDDANFIDECIQEIR